jgi:hypothetical protein
MATIDEFEGKFPKELVIKLKDECQIPMKDIQSARVCYITAKMHPDHLEMGLPLATAKTVAPEVAEAAAAVKPVTHGLASFELKPSGMSGEELFAHMAQFARRNLGAAAAAPSAYLDVEMTADQKKLLDPTPQDLTIRALMLDAGGAGAQKKLAKRKLDALGYIKAHSGIQNDPERIKRLKDTAELAASIAEVKRADAAEKKAKKIKTTGGLLDEAPAAAEKLKSKGGDPAKLKMKDIKAIALKYFGEELKANAKPALVAALQKLISASPNAIIAPSAAAAANAAAAVPTAPADGSDDDDGGDDDNDDE